MPKLKILVVEDEQILAEMYQDKFKKEGFEVIAAKDGKEGIKMMREQKPALVLLDILLPNENGIDFLKKQKKDPELSSVPIIVFSNFDDPETKKETLDLGVKEYLIKSNHNPREIVEQIKKYIKK
ncbi:MAG: response regulator [Candidatus Paceibacterota bacterium]|jgi:two-component system alkaline phosphatase synthesis response regulator PhoP